MGDEGGGVSALCAWLSGFLHRNEVERDRARRALQETALCTLRVSILRTGKVRNGVRRSAIACTGVFLVSRHHHVDLVALGIKCVQRNVAARS